jgi:GntR family transcriptional regulator/MocR family aminotransferase
MRLVYRERAEAFTSALAAHTGLRPGPCDTGMQACATTSRSDRRLRAAAAASGLEVGALSDYFVGRARDQGLVFGFGCVRPTALVAGCRTLARVLETR